MAEQLVVCQPVGLSQSQGLDGQFLWPDCRSLRSDGQRLGLDSRYQEPDSRSLKLQSHSLGRLHTGSQFLGQTVDHLGWVVKTLLLYNKFYVI